MKFSRIIIILVICAAVIATGFFLFLRQKTGAPVANDKIKIDFPLPGAEIGSPITIKGEARGPWYFEAVFPVKIIDGNGKQLGAAQARAQGEWTTTDFVPFEATLTFDKPTTPTGTLILENDNPSGLPQFADSVSVPVKFSK